MECYLKFGRLEVPKDQRRIYKRKSINGDEKNEEQNVLEEPKKLKKIQDATKRTKEKEIYQELLSKKSTTKHDELFGNSDSELVLFKLK